MQNQSQNLNNCEQMKKGGDEETLSLEKVYTSDDSFKGPVELDIKTSKRVILASLVIFLSFGPEYSSSINGSLKSTIKKNLNVDNTQFGVISSASDLINTVLPIIGGYLSDAYGVVCCHMLCMKILQTYLKFHNSLQLL